MPRRLALLVATYRYQDVGLRQLTAPGNDVEALAEVLRDPDIAGFDVTVLRNEPNHIVGRSIGEFYRNRRRDDLTFLYFTGHGLKDDHGNLYLAMTDTNRDNLLYTAVSAQHIDRSIESCLSRQKVLALDCCYSGAFPAGRISKADPEVHTLTRFQGKGRVVLTACDSTQYSFEGSEISGQGTRSVFTRILVEGLTTGKADLDGDGDVCLDELYSYVHDRVIEEMPQQRPKKYENVEGRIVVARNIHWSLPGRIRHAMESPIVRDRLVALDGLAHLHRIGNDHVRAIVTGHVRHLIDDDNQEVSATALALMPALNSVRAQQESRKLARRETGKPLITRRHKIFGSAALVLVAVMATLGVRMISPLAEPDRPPTSADRIRIPDVPSDRGQTTIDCPLPYLGTGYGPVAQCTQQSGDKARIGYYSAETREFTPTTDWLSIHEAEWYEEYVTATDGIYALARGYASVETDYGPAVYATQYENGRGRSGRLNLLTNKFYPDAWHPTAAE